MIGMLLDILVLVQKQCPSILSADAYPSANKRRTGITVVLSHYCTERLKKLCMSPPPRPNHQAPYHQTLCYQAPCHQTPSRMIAA